LIDGLIAFGFGTEMSPFPMRLGLVNGPFVPHINLCGPCYFAKVPDDP